MKVVCYGLDFDPVMTVDVDSRGDVHKWIHTGFIELEGETDIFPVTAFSRFQILEEGETRAG